MNDAMNRYAWIVLLIFLLGLFGCSSDAMFSVKPAEAPYPLMAEDEEEEEEEGEPVIATVLLYLPNRIFDLFDIVRFGVNVGLGIGVDARVTKYAKVLLATDTSAGLGFQTLRHLPICVRSRATMGLAFITTPSLNVLGWYEGDYDLKLELFVLLIGAHVAVEMGEIVDFFAGLLTYDPMEDDFRIG